MCIKLVNGNEMDSLFDEVERIKELYIKAGSKEGPMCEKWLKAAIMQNLPEKVVQTLAMDLKRANTVEDIQYRKHIYIRLQNWNATWTDKHHALFNRRYTKQRT